MSKISLNTTICIVLIVIAVTANFLVVTTAPVTATSWQGPNTAPNRPPLAMIPNQDGVSLDLRGSANSGGVPYIE